LADWLSAAFNYFCAMDLQTMIVFVLFAVAIFYIARIIYRSIAPKSTGCGSNCKCGVDFSNITPEKK